MFKIELIYNDGFNWYTQNGIFLKGYFYDERGRFYEKKSAVEYIWTKIQEKSPKELIKELNGLFSVLIQLDGKLYLYSDKSRFFTLFYSYYKNNILISDSVENLLEKTGKMDIDPLSEIEFSGLGFVFGTKTLLRNVKQIQASELLEIDEQGNKKSEILFSYKSDMFFEDDLSSLTEKANSIVKDGFERMFKSLRGRQVIVPLSGGYDSRFIATFLKDAGAKDVICFTYGKPGYKEVSISKKVAGHLGYRWFFIDHTKSVPFKPSKDENFKKYIDYASQFSSMFYLTENLSVEYLRQQKVLMNDAVFIPGHSGDVLGGSQYLKSYGNNLKFSNLARNYLYSKYTFEKCNRNSINAILANSEQFDSISKNTIKEDVRTVFEDIDIRERLAKFIINSSKVFPFYGYEIRLPFWDEKIVDFFKHVPYGLKLGKTLYNKFMIDYWFKNHNIVFDDEMEPNIAQLRFQNVKNTIKKILPITKHYKNLSNMDWANYQWLTLEMQKKLLNKDRAFDPHFHKMNSVIVRWYLLRLKEKAGVL